ncbi:MAG: GGDEF domain-containing phosphodiesterase [Pseudomonadota bacterium]
MLTAVATVLALFLSSVFTVVYFTQAWNAHQAAVHESGLQVAQLVSDELVQSDVAALEDTLNNALSGRAQLFDSDGNIVTGTMTAGAEARALEFPLTTDELNLGTLHYAPNLTFKPPLPYWAAILICLIVTVLAAFIMRMFARIVVNYVGQVTGIIEEYSLDGTGGHKISKFAFAEFRQLSIATMRATRRVSKELENLRESAKIDERTGLFNEPAFHQEIMTAIQSQLPGAQTVLVTIEINAQNPYSDLINLSLSTEAYAEAANRLRVFVAQAALKHGHNPEDWVIGSLFSERLALLIKGGTTRDDVATIIREMLGEFRIPLNMNGQQVAVTLSGSIVLIPQDGDTLSKVIDRAQATLEDLKSRGRTGFAFYSPKLERQRDAKLKLESELRQAVAEDRFVPLFQPKIDLKTGRILGAEALARWQLENGRLVSPSVFIELAEETGLIGKIGDQIMRKACAEAAQWSHHGHMVSIAVNVSPKQFEDENLAETILDALAKSGLSPRQLEIEITESLAIQQPERVRDVLEPLRRLGIKLAVDDFGTGHSNLAVLTQIDFDVFKIDRQFVMDTPHDAQANAIVDMILSMATSLEMTIVGEGIETEEQAAFLSKRNCDIGQGFLYSPPISAVAFAEMLKNQPFMLHKKSA